MQLALNWLYRNWFLGVALILLLVNGFIVLNTDWSHPLIIEGIVLISFSVFLPALYPFCYRSGLRRALVRMAALSFLGVWIASVLIPQSHHFILLQLITLRYLGIAVLFVIEVRLLVMMIQFIIANNENEDLAQALSTQGDLPTWYAKLMACEAAFWRRLYQWVKRLFN